MPRNSVATTALATPDLAVLSAGVEATVPTAKAVLAARSPPPPGPCTPRSVGAYVADSDVRTESLTLNAVHEVDRAHRPGGSRPPGRAGAVATG